MKCTNIQKLSEMSQMRLFYSFGMAIPSSCVCKEAFQRTQQSSKTTGMTWQLSSDTLAWIYVSKWWARKWFRCPIGVNHCADSLVPRFDPQPYYTPMSIFVRVWEGSSSISALINGCLTVLDMINHYLTIRVWDTRPATHAHVLTMADCSHAGAVLDELSLLPQSFQPSLSSHCVSAIRYPSPRI